MPTSHHRQTKALHPIRLVVSLVRHLCVRFVHLCLLFIHCCCRCCCCLSIGICAVRETRNSRLASFAQNAHRQSCFLFPGAEFQSKLTERDNNALSSHYHHRPRARPARAASLLDSIGREPETRLSTIESNIRIKSSQSRAPFLAVFRARPSRTRRGAWRGAANPNENRNKWRRVFSLVFV